MPTLESVEEDTSLVDVSKLSSVLDTSMTSTIDPSLFSACQRSNSLDDNFSVIGSIPEEDEEDDDANDPELQIAIDGQNMEGWENLDPLLGSEKIIESFRFRIRHQQRTPPVIIVKPPSDNEFEEDSERTSIVSM